MGQFYGKGTIFNIGSTPVGDVVNISGFNPSTGTSEITTLASEAHEYRGGLPEPGETTVTCFADFSAQASILTAVQTAYQEAQDMSFVCADDPATTWACQGVVTEYNVVNFESGSEDAVSVEIKIKWSGLWTVS